MCTNNIIMLLKFNTETYFEIYTKQVSCPLALPLLNISNCQSVLKEIESKIYEYANHAC